MAPLREDVAKSSPGFRSAKGLAVDATAKLPAIRQAVDQGFRWDQAAAAYASMQDTYLAVNTAIADSLSDPQAAAQLRTAAALASYKASLAEEGSLLAGAAESKGFDTEARYARLQGAVADEASQKAILSSIADKDAQGAVRDALASDARLNPETNRDRALASGAGRRLATTARSVSGDTTKVVTDSNVVETRLLDRLIHDANVSHTDA